MQPHTLRLMRKLHRWFGLFLSGLVLFYALTGLLLNHRQAFSYFIDHKQTVSQVPTFDTSAVQEFLRFYQKEIGRADLPRVIRLRDRHTIEFLYGSHGKTTYIINPETGTMRTIQKIPSWPWNQLNAFHKAFKTGKAWLMLADFTALACILLTLSGLIIFRYRLLDWGLLLGGVLLLAAGMYFS